MLESISYLVLLLLIYKMYQVHSMEFTFTQTLVPLSSKIQVDCTWKKGQGETMQNTEYYKDGQKFLEVTYDANGKPQTTDTFNFPGLDLIQSGNGCKAYILNFNPLSLGMYEMRVKYLDKNGILTVKKKRYNLSVKVDPCKMSWQTMGKDDPVPDGAWAAGVVDSSGDILRVCKKTDGTRVGYFEKGRGCVWVWVNVGAEETFEILMGTGLSWAMQEGVEERPDKAVLIGREEHGDIYVGRCNYESKQGAIGKITDGFFINWDEQQTGGCQKHDILVC